ncbi:MAG: hypothetical protein JSV91_07295 [Phycisphaerales bacterium]|nr:MAG: hypothetical protein JSV91_07295 [Phycisphaerales bacterium]
MHCLTGRLVWLLLVLSAAACAGCSSNQQLNPSFPLTVRQAEDALRQMRGEPKPLERPMVVLAGIHDPGLIVSALARRLGKTVTGGPIIEVSFFAADTFEECRDRVIEAVEKAVPGDVRAQTAEVDVVAISMGGLVARFAAQRRSDDGRRLNIKRLFTIATPHRGARLAVLPTLDKRQVDMRVGSAFLAALEAGRAEAGYDLLAYVRLGDAIVGPENTAPPGGFVWWVPNRPLSLSHVQASEDPRIVADIARRLRGEQPFSTLPAAPLPGAGAESGPVRP